MPANSDWAPELSSLQKPLIAIACTKTRHLNEQALSDLTNGKIYCGKVVGSFQIIIVRQ